MISGRLNLNNVIAFIYSVNLFLTILLVFKVLKFNCWVTIHRITSLKIFEIPPIISLIILLLSSIILVNIVFRGFYKTLILIPIPLILYFTFGLEYSVVVFSFSLLPIILLYLGVYSSLLYSFLIVLCIFEGLSLFYWILLHPLVLKPTFIWDVAYLELLTSSLTLSISPLILIFTLYYWIFKPWINLTPFKFRLTFELHLNHGCSWKSLVFFISSIIISLVASLYPYIPSINPYFFPVGVDFKWYSDGLTKFEINPMSIFDFLGGSRPMLIIFLYVFKSLFGFGVKEAVTFFPIILNTLFTLSIFLFVWVSFDNIYLASISAFFASMSFKITVNMYSYFLANMTALILIMYSLVFMLVYYKLKSKYALIPALIMYNLALLTHPWTYMQFSISIALMLFLQFIKLKDFKKFINEYLAFILMFTPSIPIVIIFIPFGVNQFQIFLNTIKAMNLSSLFNFWFNSLFASLLLYGGFQMNIFTLLTAFLALLYPSTGFGEELLRFMVIASSIPYPFVDGMLQSRILFNLPMEILSSLFIYRVSSSELISFKMRSSIFLLAIVSQLNYLFRCLANII